MCDNAQELHKDFRTTTATTSSNATTVRRELYRSVQERGRGKGTRMVL